MKTTVKMQIMCQMSDLPYLIALGHDANKIGNFVKALLMKYPNLDIEVEESEMEEVWNNL